MCSCVSGLVYLQGWQLCEEGADVGPDLVVRGHLPTQLLRTQLVLRTTNRGHTAQGRVRGGQGRWASLVSRLRSIN